MFRIRTGVTVPTFYTDPDPGFYFNTDPEPAPDPGKKTHLSKALTKTLGKNILLN